MRAIGTKVLVFSSVLLFASGVAFANLQQVKIYKEAFPDDKPKCTSCHVDKTPKKDDGKYEWNEYGLKVKKIKEHPDVDTYKTVGKNEAAAE